MAARRFPPPGTIEDIGAAFVVKDSAGQQPPMSISRMSRDGFNTTAMSAVDVTNKDACPP